MVMDARITTIGVRVSISRTITPAKYTAVTAYSTTVGECMYVCGNAITEKSSIRIQLV